MKKNHARFYAVTPENVARNAKPRHKKATKQEKRLEIRRKDYEGLMAKTKAPVGAYHRPGSLSK